MATKYDLSVRVAIRQSEVSGSGLAVEESAQISCETFLEVAKILGQFHELTDAIKKSRLDRK
jgi:hypothetical protein